MTGKPQSTSKIAQLLFGLLAYVSLGLHQKLTAPQRLAGKPPPVRADPVQLAQRQDHHAARQNQRHRQHAVLRRPDAGDARSRLVDLPGHRRNEPGQPVDLVPSGTARTPYITLDVGTLLPLIDYRS